MRTTTEINEKWSDYNKSVAKCHLNNYGVIFLDDYDCPIDDEYELEELYEKYLVGNGSRKIQNGLIKSI